mmetsp:Transcript_9938/g.15267  ORF Transcript_9938/g.15267 Transcript_9938/m.15267 type:complete len:427 (-) Transcript_9938:82-1362(-)
MLINCKSYLLSLLALIACCGIATHQCVFVDGYALNGITSGHGRTTNLFKIKATNEGREGENISNLKKGNAKRAFKSIRTIGTDNENTRREMIVQSMAGLTAEAAWRQAVSTAAMAAGPSVLPETTIETLESGRAAIIPNFVSSSDCEILRQDLRACFDSNQFTNFVYSKGVANKKAVRTANGKDMDIWQMQSFVKATGADGPFASPNLGNFDARQSLKARMAQVKAQLGQNLYDRPSMLADQANTHEIEYLRYGAGSSLQRHTDEHHIELLYPGGSVRSKKPNASRRSITWLIYLNEADWDAEKDGGQLRLYERERPSQNPVGARGKDLQIGWLKNSPEEQPVFLDPNYSGDKGVDQQQSCMLFTLDPKSKERRNLSSQPFPNAALYVAGGDAVARNFMVDSSDDASRFHLTEGRKFEMLRLAWEH